MMRAGEIVFLRAEHTNWLSNTKWSTLKIQVTLYRLSSLDLRIRNVYMYVRTINEKRGHKFEKETRSGT